MLGAAVGGVEHALEPYGDDLSYDLAIVPFAARLGKRLVALAEAQRDHNGCTNYQLSFTVGSTRHGAETVTTPAFWEAVVDAGAITIEARPGPQYGYSRLMALSQEHLEGLFPEALEGRWRERNTEAVQRRLRELDHEIDELRGCDFQDFANSDKYTLAVEQDTSAIPTANEGSRSGDGLAAYQGALSAAGPGVVVLSARDGERVMPVLAQAQPSIGQDQAECCDFPD